MNKHISKKKKQKKKAFTLIELLAVIIIIGIIAIIAIPSVSKYINDSRKTSYINSAKSIVNGAKALAHSEELSDTNTTYYIPAEYIKTEKELKTPYGEITEAYIGIICDEKGHTYFWASRDSSGTGIKNLTPIDSLTIDNIEEDIASNIITNMVQTTGIGNRENIKILNSQGAWDSYTVDDTINNYLENGTLPNVKYPEGKTKSTVIRGDLITIGTEGFYVVKRDENNNLVLLARYNLKVGNIYEYTTKLVKVGEYTSSDPGYEMQSSESSAYRARKTAFKGGISFSSKSYWEVEGAVHPLEAYGDESKVKKHVDNYVRKLDVVVKESRLLKGSEAVELGCNLTSRTCSGAPSFVRSTSYWLNSSYSNHSILSIMYENSIISNSDFRDNSYGIRPVIII